MRNQPGWHSWARSGPRPAPPWWTARSSGTGRRGPSSGRCCPARAGSDVVWPAPHFASRSPRSSRPTHRPCPPQCTRTSCPSWGSSSKSWKSWTRPCRRCCCRALWASFAPRNLGAPLSGGPCPAGSRCRRWRSSASRRGPFSTIPRMPNQCKDIGISRGKVACGAQNEFEITKDGSNVANFE